MATDFHAGAKIDGLVDILLASMIRLGRSPSGKVRQRSPKGSTAAG